MGSFNELVERYHSALKDFVKGNPEPMEELFSNREDVCLANPFGSIIHGWNSVKEALEKAASFYEEGTHSFTNIATYVTPELGYIIEVEKFKAKLGGKTETSSGSLRVTSIFRRENDAWKVVQRHADPLTSKQTSYKVNN